MPIYEYKGVEYEMSEEDPTKAKAKILAYLKEPAAKPASKAPEETIFDRLLPKGTPSWMISKPGQGWDDANVSAAGGDPTNPMAYLSEAQKTEAGPALQKTGKALSTGLRVGAGLTKGAVLNPILAGAQVLGGQQYVQDVEQAYQQQRAAAGGEGFDWSQLAGGIVSPINRFLPAGSTTQRAAMAGALGAASVPVEGMDLTPEEIAAGKVEQLGLGAVIGRVGSKFADALTPTLKPGVKELIEKGIPVTPGQAYEGPIGGLFRQIEKLDIPWMRVNKEAVNLAYTKSVGDDVLSSIGEKLPPSVKNGQQAFAYINNKLGEAYDNALEKIGTVPVDDTFKAALDQTRQTLSQTADSRTYKAFHNYIKADVLGRLKNGTITGRELKKVEENLRKAIDGIKATDRPSELLKAGYDDVYKAVKGFIARNDATGDVLAANQGWMKQARMLEAVNKNAAELKGAQGTFTPAEMAKIAAKQGDQFAAAKGTAPLQAEANRALDIVGDTTNEYQKFRNAMILGKLTGLGALGLFSPTIALPILTASGLSYAAAKQLMKDPGATRAAVQQALQNNPGLFGQAASLIREENK